MQPIITKYESNGTFSVQATGLSNDCKQLACVVNIDMLMTEYRYKQNPLSKEFNGMSLKRHLQYLRTSAVKEAKENLSTLIKEENSKMQLSV